VQAILRYVVAGVILLAIVAFMTTFTVRFTETAVVTTFGRADEQSVIKEPGLRFRLPYPIQSVTKYDSRVRYLESRPETRQTADDRQVILTAFLTYRVADPLKFYQLFSDAGARAETHYRRAEEILGGKLRGAMGRVSNFKLRDLFSAEGESRLPELERQILSQLAAKEDGSPSLAEYGIEAVAVGVSSVKLPQETSKAVFERMQQTRERIAQEAFSRGTAEASRIRSEAESDAQKILAFAERRAKAIRGQGDKEAAEYIAKQSANPELAVFLKNLEFMREALSKRTTLVLPTNFAGMSLFTPAAGEQLRSGKIPVIDADPASSAAGQSPAGGGK
jgi:membrane protease subunit HflC